MNPDGLFETLETWCAKNPQSVAWLAEEHRLMCVPSGKSLGLDPTRVAALEEKANEEVGGTYLVLLFEDGPQLVLASPGLAWPPIAEDDSPIAESLPTVVCWQDFERLVGAVQHQLDHHPDEKPTKDSVLAITFGIAVLDGARAVGFEVGGAERRLEALLSEVETRFRAGG